MKRTTLIFSFLLISSLYGFSQGTWWDLIHDWDRITPWQRYLTTSPGFMGPNAFPIPEIKVGIIENSFCLETAIEGHFSEHEETKNLFARIFIPLPNKKLGISLFIVPLEIYEFDEYLRDQRSSPDYDGQGVANGDLYIGTHIQLLKDHQVFPDILLTINIKTASGNQYRAARFSDTPGYYFDLSFGKSFVLNKARSSHIRLYSMLGIYTWRTNLVEYPMNDALILGMGAKFQFKSLSINQNIGGFSGRLNNGDHPRVYRMDIQSRLKENVNYKIRFQYGLRDYNYQSIRFSILYNLKPNG